MSHTIHQLEANQSTETLPPLHSPHDDPFPRELLEHIDRLRLILPVISVSVMALNRRDAESATDIAVVLNEHACRPLDDEIERIESLLSLYACRHPQEEARQ